MTLWDDNPNGDAANAKPGAYTVCIYCGQVLMLNAECRGVPVELSSAPRDLQDLLLVMRFTALAIGPALREKHKHRKPPTE